MPWTEPAAASERGVAAVRGDLRDPGGITASPHVLELIDFGEPVAVLLFAMLHFVPDADDPYALLARFGDVMAPGSALAPDPDGAAPLFYGGVGVKPAGLSR